MISGGRMRSRGSSPTTSSTSSTASLLPLSSPFNSSAISTSSRSPSTSPLPLLLPRPPVRLSSLLVVSSPSAAEECLSKNDVAFANRPRLLAGKHLGYNYTNLVWSSYGDHWRNLRRLSSLELLSLSRLQLLSHIRADEVKRLIKRLATGTDCGHAVDMKSAFFDLMMNVAMRMIAEKRYCGCPPNCLRGRR